MSAEDGGRGFLGTTALVLLGLVSLGLVVLALLPEHRAVALSGASRAVEEGRVTEAKRTIVQARVALAAAALAIWLGVLISMYLGGA